jgi:hypothetical protein
MTCVVTITQRPRVIAVVGLLATVALSGCVKPPVKVPPAPLPIEPEPVAALVERFNANADRMPEGIRLSSPPVAVQAGYLDDEGREHVFDGDGWPMLFAKPNRFFMKLRSGGFDVAEIGSDGQIYWLWFKERQTVWWGRYKHIDKPRIRDMPIRPDQLIATLGLTRLPEGTGWPALPLRKVERYPTPCDLLYYWRVDEGRPRLDREYGLSRRPPYLTERVVFYDELGRIGCEATLAKWGPVEVKEKVISGPGPIMPSEIWLHWPKGNAYFHMSITKPELKPLSEKLRQGWYSMKPPSGWKVIQIDEEYDRPASSLPTASSGPASAPASRP